MFLYRNLWFPMNLLLLNCCQRHNSPIRNGTGQSRPIHTIQWICMRKLCSTWNIHIFMNHNEREKIGHHKYCGPNWNGMDCHTVGLDWHRHTHTHLQFNMTWQHELVKMILPSIERWIIKYFSFVDDAKNKYKPIT